MEEKFKFAIESKDYYDILINLAKQSGIEFPEKYAATILELYQNELNSKKITKSQEDFIKFLSRILKEI